MVPKPQEDAFEVLHHDAPNNNNNNNVINGTTTTTTTNNNNNNNSNMNNSPSSATLVTLAKSNPVNDGDEDEDDDIKTDVTSSSSSTTSASSLKEEPLILSQCEQWYGPYPKVTPQPMVTPPNNNNNNNNNQDTNNSNNNLIVLQVDYRDVGTPDQWLPRDGRLVRLTGRHPFNVEPPLSLLHQYKFLTPSSLHYVRNHGACPKLSWETHTLYIGGGTATTTNDCTPQPYQLSMDQLVQLPCPVRELPVTLVCAGNRRKEQNMIRPTIGFAWGPSGVATNVYKGILVRDLLQLAGITDDFVQSTPPPPPPSSSTASPLDVASSYCWHVEFIGVEDLPNKVGPGPFANQNEPWGKLVKYGTSLPLARVMNPAYDVLVAYQANGEALLPDHGYPIRLVIPGYIGGRMIKWLHHIRVIPHETHNHYHYHDNRILPPHITAEESLQGNWWYKPEYIFNELNINSVLTQPNHNDVLHLNDTNLLSGSTCYQLAGYAYTGGGRAVTRVEITYDQGHTWHLCTLDRKERPTPHGMYWCWVWFHYNLPIPTLIRAQELWVRAWDAANNTQPNEPTWNLMGMGNNQVFRVKIHWEQQQGQQQQQTVVRFEHPTQPGQLTGGWMTTPGGKPESAGFGRLIQQGQADESNDTASSPPPPPPTTTNANIITNSNVSSSSSSSSSSSVSSKKTFTLQDVAQHNTEHDCWIIIKNKVYDCTEYLELHPGGIDSITINAGSDATEDFVAIHSLKATKMLERYYIGDLVVVQVQEDDSTTPAAVKTASGTTTTTTSNNKDVDGLLVDELGRKLALNPRKKTPFRLQGKQVLSRDSILLDFALPTPDHVLGLPTGKHMFFSAMMDGELVMRRYTPISSNHDIGCVKFVIKVYRPNDHFPKGGKMSQYLDGLQVGDYLDFRGPVGEFDYQSQGNFFLEGKSLHHAQCFNMIAGGTGITPCLQVAAEILRHDDDPTRISLLFACREEGDLLMRTTLDEWAEQYPDKFKVHYVLSDSWPENWQFSTGFVSKALFEQHLYPPGQEVYNLMCGPPIMLDKGCTPNLVALGHSRDKLLSF